MHVDGQRREQQRHQRNPGKNRHQDARQGQVRGLSGAAGSPGEEDPATRCTREPTPLPTREARATTLRRTRWRGRARSSSGRSATRAASWRARICARHQTIADEGGEDSCRAARASASSIDETSATSAHDRHSRTWQASAGSMASGQRPLATASHSSVSCSQFDGFTIAPLIRPVTLSAARPCDGAP